MCNLQEYEANEALEKEIRVQLSRQTAAHSDHLAEVLKVQEATLRKTFNRESEGKILDERERMRSEIILWISRMEGIEHALESEFVYRPPVQHRHSHSSGVLLGLPTLLHLVPFDLFDGCGVPDEPVNDIGP